MAKKTNAPWDLSEIEKRRIVSFVKSSYPTLAKPKLVRELWEQCRDWHLSNGKQRVNWEATFRNWIRGHDKFQRERRFAHDRERPQEQGSRGGEMVNLQDFFRKVE